MAPRADLMALGFFPKDRLRGGVTRAALVQLVEAPGPVLLEEPRQRPVRQEAPLGLAGRAVVRLVVGVDDALDLRAAHRTGLAELAVDGEFGAEAGARYAFGKSARALTPREAALLAAILPNPIARSARRPGPGVQRLAAIYQGRAAVVAVGCIRMRRG